MTQKRILILSAVVVTLLFAALVVTRLQAKNEKAEALKNAVTPPTAVVALPATQGSISDTLSLSGNVVAQEKVTVVAKGAGRLMTLNVQEGSAVVKGQLLGMLEHHELNAQLEQAQAAANVAKANLDQTLSGPLQTQVAQSQASIDQLKASRAQLQANLEQNRRDLSRQQQLFNEAVGTPQQLETLATQVRAMEQQVAAIDAQIAGAQASHQQLLNGSRPEQIASARAQYQQALASVKIYQTQLQNYALIAPINGVVTQKQLDVGNFVTTSSPVLTLEKQGPVEIEVYLPERDLPRVKVKQAVEIRASAYGNKIFAAEVARISPVVDPQTRLVKLTVRPLAKTPLQSGMLVDCDLILARHQNTFTVPLEAVIQGEEPPKVYVEEAGVVQARPVTLGLRTAESIEIVSGIQAQDQVIVKGMQYVRPGDKVLNQTEQPHNEQAKQEAQHE